MEKEEWSYLPTEGVHHKGRLRVSEERSVREGLGLELGRVVSLLRPQVDHQDPRHQLLQPGSRSDCEPLQLQLGLDQQVRSGPKPAHVLDQVESGRQQVFPPMLRSVHPERVLRLRRELQV